MLAERPRTYAFLFAALTANAYAIVTRPTTKPEPAPEPRVLIASIPPAPIDIDCPAHARAALRIESPVALFCRHTDRGTFAIAQYMTTERWERMVLLDHEGSLVFPLVDQPTPGNVAMTDVSIGGVHKTVGYSNGRSMRVMFDRDVLALDYTAE